MPQATGKKWDPALAVAEAKAALRHQDIMGQVQHGRRGLDLRTKTPTWQKATPYGVEEEAARCVRVVSQAQQGCWVRWKGLQQCKITWSNLWNMEMNRLRHPTRKAIRDKERIDRDNTRSQSKHAQEMLSAQTVWNQLRPEARERDSEMVLGEGGREKWRESE
ncbi:hypothetical protein DPX16_12701 [Anabarilius grahami]|uniref:Uncharacterized protein n=1 Tax=Anabarilius grahami TaxID=495550 RepID=A0A3N0XTE5_ANAGA|nr:hypothetical protein DPX16_12701 [Anabarilius grahami]